MKAKLGLAVLLALMMALPVLAASERVDIDISGRPQLGPADAPVTIIEFLDFQ